MKKVSLLLCITLLCCVTGCAAQSPARSSSDSTFHQKKNRNIFKANNLTLTDTTVPVYRSYASQSVTYMNPDEFFSYVQVKKGGILPAFLRNYEYFSLPRGGLGIRHK